MGVKKGDRVVAAKNHPDWAIGYFGILRAGAVAVPVDAELDGHAFANVAREADARVGLSTRTSPRSPARRSAPSTRR